MDWNYLKLVKFNGNGIKLTELIEISGNELQFMKLYIGIEGLEFGVTRSPGLVYSVILRQIL